MIPYLTLRTYILREVNRQVTAPKSIIRLRLYYYYNLPRDFLWTAIWTGLNQALDEGIVLRYPADAGWVHGSRARESPVNAAYDRKKPTWDAYQSALPGSGKFLEELVRLAFRGEGYAVSERPIDVAWTEAGTTNSKEIDVLTLGPQTVALEIKNKLSDVYSNPTFTPNPNDDHRQIEQLFKLSSAWGITPGLIAPAIDGSFYPFQDPYAGIHGRCLFQYLSHKHSATVKQFQEDFRFGHVRSVPADTVPPSLASWVRRVPKLIQRSRERRDSLDAVTSQDSQ